MHSLRKVIAEVERTHSRLGNLAAFSLACAKSHKCLLIVGPPGCGKSVVLRGIAKLFPEKIVADSITRSSLTMHQDQYNGFRGLVVIDDMGGIDTIYNRHATISTFAKLCYDHFVIKYSANTILEIENFHGSAILNCQPPIMSQLMIAGDWESLTQDKTIRYYHLFRPQKAIYADPQFHIESDVPIEDVKLIGKDGRRWRVLCDMGYSQWSDARSEEHVGDLLKACAAWDKRRVVNQSDYLLLLELMIPVALERHLVSKFELDAHRHFNTNLLALVIELASWNRLTIRRICRDYKCDPPTVYRVIEGLKDYFAIGLDGPDIITVLPKAKEILREAGVRI